MDVSVSRGRLAASGDATGYGGGRGACKLKNEYKQEPLHKEAPERIRNCKDKTPQGGIGREMVFFY